MLQVKMADQLLIRLAPLHTASQGSVLFHKKGCPPACGALRVYVENRRTSVESCIASVENRRTSVAILTALLWSLVSWAEQQYLVLLGSLRCTFN